jgi:hypothetical protein
MRSGWEVLLLKQPCTHALYTAVTDSFWTWHTPKGLHPRRTPNGFACSTRLRMSLPSPRALPWSPRPSPPPNLVECLLHC